MSATIKRLTSKVVDLDIDFEDDPRAVCIQFSPSKYTPGLEKRVIERAEAKQELGPIVEALQTVLVSWDLREDEDTPVLDFKDDKVMDTIPGALLYAIIEQIGESQKPDPKAGE